MNTSMITFWVVTFAWSFALALWCLWRFFFRCLRDWEPLVERELPARAEILKASGENIALWRRPEDLMKIAEKTFFAIISCKKCGAVKEYQVRT